MHKIEDTKLIIGAIVKVGIQRSRYLSPSTKKAEPGYWSYKISTLIQSVYTGNIETQIQGEDERALSPRENLEYARRYICNI